MFIITNTTIKNNVYSALASRTREFKQRLSFGEWQVSGTNRSFAEDITYEKGIIKLDISQQGNSDGSGLVMGCCCSSSCTAEFYNLDKTYNYHEKIMFVECGVKLSDDSFFYIPCGYYKVDKPETDDDWRTVKVTAYDDVDRMGNKWTSNLTYPSTAYLVLKEITDKYGIELDFGSGISTILRNRTITEAEALTLTSYTEREVCGFIAGLAGANARMNSIGAMRVSWYTEQPAGYDVSIPANLQWQNGFKKTAESAFVINSITSGIDDAVFTAGTGTGITFANPIITESEITTIYEKYGGMRFQPCTCEWRGNPCLECGDIVTVTDRNSVEYTIYIANQDIDLTGGLSMSVTCPGGDADISFDTVDERTRAALNRQYTALQQAIIDASNAINGALGGYYEILDSDGDGNPDGWLIKEYQDGTGGIIRANKAGIGLSTDGGVNYITAITYKGINANCITAGKINAELIDTENLLVGIGNVDGLDTELASLLAAANAADKKAGNAQITASSASSLAEALKVAGFCEENGITYVNGAKIFTGSITANQIAAGAITADKLTVGDLTNYCRVNSVSYKAYDFTKIEESPIESWPTTINYWFVPTTYDKTGYDLGDWVDFAYNKDGDNKFLYQGQFYNTRASTYAYFCVKVMLDNGKTYYFNQGAGSRDIYCYDKGVHTFSKTIELDVEYGGNKVVKIRPAIKFDTAPTDSYWFAINNITFRRATAGDITAGKLQSADGNTYFDLDNSVIKTEKYESGLTFSSQFSTGALTYSVNSDTSDYLIGGIDGVLGTAGAVATRRMAMYSPTGILLGIGNNASDTLANSRIQIGADAIGIYNNTSVLVNSNLAVTGNAAIAGDITAKGDVSVSGELITTNTSYSGCRHIRIGFGKVKVGVGKEVPMWNNSYRYTTASLELSEEDSDDIIARLDVSPSWGTACGVISVNSANGRSSPLELGSGSTMWFNGNAVTASSSEKYKTNIQKYTYHALDLVNKSVVYSYNYKDDGDNALTKYGLIIERECPTEVVDNSGDAISLYSMCSILWKSVQELSDKVTTLEVNQNA